MAAGVNPKTWYELESKQHYPSLDNLLRISRFYGVDIDWIVGLSDCHRSSNQEPASYTGLSEDSLNHLHAVATRRGINRMHRQGDDIFDLSFESERRTFLQISVVNQMLSMIEDYFEYIPSSLDNIVIKQIPCSTPGNTDDDIDFLHSQFYAKMDLLMWVVDAVLSDWELIEHITDYIRSQRIPTDNTHRHWPLSYRESEAYQFHIIMTYIDELKAEAHRTNPNLVTPYPDDVQYEVISVFRGISEDFFNERLRQHWSPDGKNKVWNELISIYYPDRTASDILRIYSRGHVE